MAKPRVHEIAKQLGTDSKTIIAKLTEMGEYVKSASATVEAPVIRKLKEAFPAEQAAPESKAPAAKKTEPAANGAPAASRAKPGPKKPATAKNETAAPEQPAEKPADKAAEAPAPEQPAAEVPAAEQPAAEAPAAQQAETEQPVEKPSSAAKPADKPATTAKPGPAAPKPGPKPAPKAPAKPGKAAGKSGGSARPGNNPFATSQGMPRSGGPRPGRPGNNPYATSQGMPRPGSSRPAPEGRGDNRAPRPGAPRPGAPRPGAPRPNPGMMPGKSTVGRPGQPSSSGRPGGGPGRGRGGGPGGGPGGGRPGGGFGKGGRGRGGTQGAFGRGGGRPVRGRKSKRAKRQELEQMQAPSVGGVSVPRGDGNTPLRLRRGSSLGDFADKIGADPASLVTVLFHLGEMATATQSLDEDTFKVLGDELGYKIQIVSPEDEDRELLEEFDIDIEGELEGEDDSQLLPRPPVVTVMGHVDHGKTKLLDAVRSSDVVAGESGGITQHIGAYQVHVDHEGEERALTFIDTPGHEAFTAMRARGAKVTDLAILVVAADDGVMPQTIEALNHAQAAGVPIVVAVNKIDKEGANPAKIKQQLTEYNLVAEEYGGETMFVEISALQRQGIGDLLEAVLLTADAALDLRANPDKAARGIAIEANLDKGRGAVATVLVQSGTLHAGDAIVAGTAFGRVRAMFDEYGKTVAEAGPARPVQVLGLSSVPRAGDTFLSTGDDRTARQIAEKRETAERAAQLAKRRKRVSLEDFTQALEDGKVDTLNLILKGDVSGAVEALEDALLKIDVGDEVALRVIHRGVGAITQNDVNLATVDNAIIIGFNVRYAERVEDYADREGVDVRFYSVIYQAIDDVESALKGMLKPEFEEIRTGSAEVREVFRSSKFGNIAGSIVRDGVITRNSKARLTRDGTVVSEKLSIESLRRFKDDATEVRDGYECGIGLGSFNDIKEGDMIETFEMREKPRE